MPIQYIYPDNVAGSFRILNNSYIIDSDGNTILGSSGGSSTAGVTYIDEGFTPGDYQYLDAVYSGSTNSYNTTFSYSGHNEILPQYIQYNTTVQMTSGESLYIILPTNSIYEYIKNYTPTSSIPTTVYVASGRLIQDGGVLFSFDENTPYTGNTYSIPNPSGSKTRLTLELFNFPLSGSANLYTNPASYDSGLYYNIDFNHFTQFYYNQGSPFNGELKIFNSEILVSGIYGPQSNSVNFLLYNIDAQPTGLPLYIRGSEYSSGSLDMYIHGNLQEAINMVLIGKDYVPSGQSIVDFYLDATPPLDEFGFIDFYLMNNSGGYEGINLYLKGFGSNPDGSDDYSNSVPFITYAISGQTSGTVDFTITGGTAEHIPLFIDCHPFTDSSGLDFVLPATQNSGAFALYTMLIEGERIKSAELNFYLDNSSANSDTSSINMLINGAYSSYQNSFEMTLYNAYSGANKGISFLADGGETGHSGIMNLFINRDSEFINGGFPFFIANSGISSGVDMFIDAVEGIATSGLNFVTLGTGEYSGQVHLYINGF